MFAPRTKKMSTGIEKVFRGIENHPGLYREVILHWIHFINESTGEIMSSKLDKQIQGKLYKLALGNERSLHGEAEYAFPDGVTRRLVCVPEGTVY
jgi:hypothetical protein